MRLLVLAHVDGDDVVLAAVERLGQRQRRLGLADAGRTAQQEHADRLVRVLQAGARGLDATGDHLHRVVLADHPLPQRILELEDRLDLVLHHAADGDAGPVLDHLGDRLLVDADQHQRRFALHVGELRLQLPEPAERLVPFLLR